MPELTPECRLYLALSQEMGRAALRDLDIVLSAGDVACLLLHNHPDDPFEDSLAREIIALAKKADIPVLIENDIDLALRLEANGVHLSGTPNTPTETFESAKEKLSQAQIIGVTCGQSRHDAMVLGEAGADYIAFTPEPFDAKDQGMSQLEMITWWSDLFVVPCVAFDIKNLKDIGTYAKAGADFVCVGKPVWKHTSGLKAGVDLALAELETNS